MKFWAKLRFKGEKNAKHLNRAFFKEFNPESIIRIIGKEAYVVIIFNNTPPMKIIKAINECEIIGFGFGKEEEELPEEIFQWIKQLEEDGCKNAFQGVVEEEKSEHTEQVEQREEESKEAFQGVVEESSKHTEQAEESEEECKLAFEGVVEEENSKHTEQADEGEEDSKEAFQGVVDAENSKHTEQAEETKKKSSRVANGNAKPRKAVAIKTVELPKLEEIAKKATSFEHFAKLVGEWLEMEKWQQLFENLSIVVTEVEVISWKELDKALQNKGLEVHEWEKVQVRQQVSKMLKEHSVTLLPLLNTMRQYKNYSFSYEMIEEKLEGQEIEERVISVQQEVSSKIEELLSQKRVKMECMPEIPHFEEILANIDKTQQIEDRVGYILNAMGLKNKTEDEQQHIFETAIVAVKIREMDFYKISSKVNIGSEYWTIARMNFAKFVDDFVSEYDSDKQVKLLDFLKELQQIVLTESEIENLN